MSIKFYGYWCLIVFYCVWIVLNLKGVEYEYVFVYFVNNGGEQYSSEYMCFNFVYFVFILVDEDEDIILN